MATGAAGPGKEITLSVEGRQWLNQRLDGVFVLEIDLALPEVERLLGSVDEANLGADYAGVRGTLRSLWEFFASIRLIRSEGNFLEARALLQSAAGGFEQSGYPELQALSMGMTAYCQAVAEFGQQNVGRALEILTLMKQFFRRAGRYGSQFEVFIDHTEPEALFVASIQALQNLDVANAKILVDRAAVTAEHVARTYHANEPALYNTYLGTANLYRAFYAFLASVMEFNQFEYARLAEEEQATRYALEAQRLLAEADVGNLVVRNQGHLATAVLNLHEVLLGLSRIMRDVCASTFKADVKTLSQLRRKVRAASDAAAQAGPQAATLVRYCGMFRQQIENLEKLARPKKKDFGALSGVISCALFLPLFLLVSWANQLFSIGLESGTLLGSCVALALVGGFGYGAVRFRSLFSFRGSAEES